MAHTDACKYQVCQFVEKFIKNGVGINQACKETEKESDGIPESTIKRWWYEIKKETGKQFKNELSATPPPTPQNHTENQENQSPFAEIKAPRKHRATGEAKGGRREGAGRRPKHKPIILDLKASSIAMDCAAIAISQLERIAKYDPMRSEALDSVVQWITDNN